MAKNKSQQTQYKLSHVKSLLFVFSSSILSSFLLMGIMLYYYSPSGNYLSQNVLLDPKNIFELSFSDREGLLKERYKVDRIEWIYFDKALKEKKTLLLSETEYAAIYALLKNDESLKNPDRSVVDQFDKMNLSFLNLIIKNQLNSNTPTSLFLKVEFSDEGDYYRVNIRQQGLERDSWVYFFHREIYKTLMKSFNISQVK